MENFGRNWKAHKEVEDFDHHAAHREAHIRAASRAINPARTISHLEWAQAHDRKAQQLRAQRFSWKEGDLDFGPVDQPESEVAYTREHQTGGSAKSPIEREYKEVFVPHKRSKTERSHSARIEAKFRGKKHARMAMQEYKDDGSWINRSLRKGKVPDSMKERIEHIARYTKHRHPVNVTAYRSIQDHGLAEKLWKQRVGSTFKDKGFTSTTLDPEQLHDFNNHKMLGKKSERVEGAHIKHSHVIKIHVPKGTKAHYIDSAHSRENSHEKEFLLHHGTTFKVTGHSLVHEKGETKFGQPEHIVHHVLHVRVHKQD